MTKTLGLAEKEFKVAIIIGLNVVKKKVIQMDFLSN